MTEQFTRVGVIVILILSLIACSQGSGTETTSPDVDAPGTTASAPANTSAAIGSLGEITIGHSQVVPGADMAHYSSLPIGLGFWEDEGLIVTQEYFAGTGEVIQALEAGHIAAGTGGYGPIWPGTAEGNIDVRVFHNITSSLAYVAPHVPVDSEITDPAQLAGARVGIQAHGSGVVPPMEAMVAEAGADPSEIIFLPVGLGPEAIAFLESGEIDVVGLWDAQHAMMEHLGVELRPISSDYINSIGFAQGLYALPATIDERADVLSAYARGIAKATLFAQENPEAAARIHFEVYPDAMPSGVEADEAVTLGAAIIAGRLEHSQPVEGLWGYATDDQILRHMEMHLGAGTIAQMFDVDDIWNDALIEDINDFDEQEIIELARSH